MKRAILSLFLALCLFFSTAPAQAASAGYSDIPSGHWSEESVARATELGLFQGVGDGLFGQGQPITRAAFVTALVRLFGWDEVSPSTPAFTDVESHRWFYAAVETALANGAVTATSRTFRPTDNITREEMAVMLVRALGYASLAGTASGYSSPFTDMTTNRGYITIAYDLGIVGGVGDGRFAPDQTATREQAAAMLVRVYDRLYAASTRLASSGSRVRITVDTPQASAGQSVPTTPLEPIAELYATLREMKNRGRTSPARCCASPAAGCGRWYPTGSSSPPTVSPPTRCRRSWPGTGPGPTTPSGTRAPTASTPPTATRPPPSGTRARRAWRPSSSWQGSSA